MQKLLQHKGNLHVPEFRSDEDAAHHLEQFLEEKMKSSPILLVLDDVWPESDSLLDNLKFQIPNYKVLVTSTSLFPRFGSTYKLKPLNDDDSMTLFRHSAFPDGEAYTQDERLVNEVNISQLIILHILSFFFFDWLSYTIIHIRRTGIIQNYEL